jgi:hypothetical protein
VVLGHLLRGADDDSYMLAGDAAHPTCDVCGVKVDPSWVDPAFVPSGRWDFATTYDGYTIVSDRFRAAAADAGGAFIDLVSAPGFYVLDVHETVEFDATRRRTRFEDFCRGCDRYLQVAGATPVFLLSRTVLPDRIVRTDVLFGSFDELHPLLLVGPGLAARLTAASLAGLQVVEVGE